jgi:hypothetical protein
MRDESGPVPHGHRIHAGPDRVGTDDFQRVSVTSETAGPEAILTKLLQFDDSRGESQEAIAAQSTLRPSQTQRREHLLDHVRSFLNRSERELSAAWERNDAAAGAEHAEDCEWAVGLLAFGKRP